MTLDCITRPVSRVRIETTVLGTVPYLRTRITRPVSRVRIETILATWRSTLGRHHPAG